MQHIMTDEKPGKRLLIESAIANIFEQPESQSVTDIDWLDLTWLECRARASRNQTRAGRHVSMILKLNSWLRHGDVLHQSESGSTIVVNLLPAEVMAVCPRYANEWGAVAYELGNLHIPVEMISTELLIPRDPAVEALLERLTIPFEVSLRRFQPNFWPEFVNLSKSFRVIES